MGWKIAAGAWLVASVVLLMRSYSVWNRCGYDCPVWSGDFPLQISSAFGMILAAAMLVLLAVGLLAWMLERGK